MRANTWVPFLVALAAVLGGLQVAAGQSPGATQSATATATPVPTASATQTPTPAPEYDGRPCESGTDQRSTHRSQPSASWITSP